VASMMTQALVPVFHDQPLVAHTRVGCSDVHGKGVYASKAIAKDQIFCSYPAHGVRVSFEDQSLYAPNPTCEDTTEAYRMSAQHLSVMLGNLFDYQLRRGPLPGMPQLEYAIVGLPGIHDHHGHLINHSTAANAKFFDCRVIALCDIQPGAEILCDYGPTYLTRCRVCGKNSTARCGRCGTVVYCGAEHQGQHWKIHKRTCAKLSAMER